MSDAVDVALGVLVRVMVGWARKVCVIPTICPVAATSIGSVTVGEEAPPVTDCVATSVPSSSAARTETTSSSVIGIAKRRDDGRPRAVTSETG